MQVVKLPTHTQQLEIQEKAQRLVRENVHQCGSMLISELSKNEQYMEELLEVCSKSEYRYEIYSAEGQPVMTCYSPEDAEEKVEELGENFHWEEEEDHIEALEHWIVSDWLGRQLEERGEMVMEFHGLTIWGRTTSGQQIICDGVIEDIAVACY